MYSVPDKDMIEMGTTPFVPWTKKRFFHCRPKNKHRNRIADRSYFGNFVATYERNGNHIITGTAYFVDEALFRWA